jgi:branched-chain amino acid transport system substrate-binding protein
MLTWLRNTVLLGVLIAFGASNCAMAQSDKDLKIGLAIALSGWLATYDAEGIKMAELWMDQQNAKGGLLGRKLVPIIADTKTDRVEGAKAGQQLVSDSVEMMIVSADYDFGAPAALQAQKAGLISVFLAAEDTKAGILGVGPLSFSAATTGQLEGATMADWGYKNRGYRKGYVLLDNSIEYHKSTCAGYDWMFPKLGGTIVGRDTFKNDDASIASQVTRLSNAIRDGGVDNIMFCSHTPGAVSALRQIRAAGINVPIFNGTGMDGTYWTSGVPGLTDFYVPVEAIVSEDANPEVNALTKAYTEKYGVAPTTQYAYPIYAWLQLWAKAVTKVGTTDSKAVVTEMNTYNGAPTVLGPRTLSSKIHIENSSPLTIVEISDNKQHVVARWQITETIPDEVLYRLKKAD